MADTTPDVETGRHACPLCPERFESVGDKKRHMKTQHQGVTR